MGSYGRYRNSILDVANMLRRLEEDKSNYDLLLALQRRLVRLICRTERRIVRLKQLRATLNATKRRGRHAKAEAAAIKTRATRISASIETAKHMLFIWRCFGDGIAFLYIDKYALKHMLYDSTDYSVKQQAGALSGKVGFRLEWRLLRAALQRRVPAMMCDISNTLRHGDVCILVGPDPFPIEVKSSKNRNARVDRQVDGLKQLHSFLAADEATNFRGLKHVKRMEAPVSSVSHGAVMNDCIERARQVGAGQASPEDGLTYFCIRDPEYMDQLVFNSSGGTILTILNEPKNEGDWMPYYPFTLSIRSAESLYDFISGEISLAVLLDTTVLLRMFSDQGLDAQFVEDRDYIVMVQKLNADPASSATSVISRAFFARIFFEFESLSWLPQREAWFIKHLEDESRIQDQKIASGELSLDDLMTGPVPTFRPLKWPAPLRDVDPQKDQ